MHRTGRNSLACRFLKLRGSTLGPTHEQDFPNIILDAPSYHGHVLPASSRSLSCLGLRPAASAQGCNGTSLQHALEMQCSFLQTRVLIICFSPARVGAPPT